MKKFFVYAKNSSNLNLVWWESLTPEKQAKHIEDHPDSKYAVAARKKEEDNSKANPVPAPAPAAPSPAAPAPAAPSPDSESTPPPPLIEVDEEDEEVAIKAVRKKLSEMNFGEIAAAMRKPPEDEEGFNSAHALAFGLCFLVALTLIVALPESSADSIKILASHVANNYYESITKPKYTEDKEKKKPPALNLTSAEQADADARKANNRQLGYDEHGNLISDNAADSITRLFLRTNRRAIV